MAPSVAAAVDMTISTETLKNHVVVPVIDFSTIRHEKSSANAKKLFDAFRDTGFVYLQNHGVPQDVVDVAFAWSAKFFDLPQEIKDKAPHPPEGWWHRGYSGIGKEKVSQMLFDDESIREARKIPDQKESFEMGREDNPNMPNIWLPEEDLPGFRDFFNRFYKICHGLELDILRALALGMDLEEDFFVAYHQNADNQTRILHYPPIPEQLLRGGKAERIAAHSDFGTITLLFQDKVGGLEIEDAHKEGVFRPVPYIPGTVVVNIGDFMKMWTNDILKSSLHRVQAPPLLESEEGEGGMTPARYSIPYFCGPDTEKTVECAPGCYGPDRPKKYEPMTVGEYIDMRMNALY